MLKHEEVVLSVPL